MSFANVCSVLALMVALGTGTAYAANTVFSEDIVNGEVKTADIHSQAVTAGKIQANAVGGAKVANESLTTADLLGVDVTGTISLSGIQNGRCATVSLNISGAQTGQVPVIETLGPMQNGMMLNAQRVPSANHVEVAACNLTGGAMDPITDLPIRMITFD